MRKLIERWKAIRRKREAYRRYGCDVQCSCGVWMHSDGNPQVLEVAGMPGCYDYICDRCWMVSRWDFMAAPAPILLEAGM